ncbi:hypothetical protein NRIC_02630 [Enterococcus florum]|uniref:Uncharacterized protein n=1 Tax=Enterococcus florum TaxID=2480627 RepID=A0A4P5PA55_9ENTE|nr:hypothetical protein NRIC_02630 [Enterococcus florum]
MKFIVSLKNYKSILLFLVNTQSINIVLLCSGKKMIMYAIILLSNQVGVISAIFLRFRTFRK